MSNCQEGCQTISEGMTIFCLPTASTSQIHNAWLYLCDSGQYGRPPLTFSWASCLFWSSIRNRWNFFDGWKIAEEIEFENRHFWNFKSHVTLTLTLDDLESHIVMNVSSTLTNTIIWFVAALSLIVNVRMDVRMDGHFYQVYWVISGDDLKMLTVCLILYKPKTYNCKNCSCLQFRVNFSGLSKMTRQAYKIIQSTVLCKVNTTIIFNYLNRTKIYILFNDISTSNQVWLPVVRM